MCECGIFEPVFILHFQYVYNIFRGRKNMDVIRNDLSEEDSFLVNVYTLAIQYRYIEIHV